MDYFIWELLKDETLPTPDKDNIQCYCLLIPKVDNDHIGDFIDDNHRIYGCINSVWEELVNRIGFTRPKNISTYDLFVN